MQSLLHPRPRGYSLLFVMTTLSVLFAGTAVLLVQVTGVAQLAGGTIRAGKTLNAARSGAALGGRMLEDKLYAYDGAPMDLTKVRQLPSLAASDVLCADGSDCSAYRLLADALEVGSNKETARIAVNCNPNGCGGDEKDIVNFQLRVAGSLDGSNVQIVEVTLVPDPDQ